MKIEEYIDYGYYHDFDLKDMFFDSLKSIYYYEPMSISKVLTIFSETIDDLFYNYEFSKKFENMDFKEIENYIVLRDYVLTKIDRFIRREEYRITGLWRSTQLDSKYSPIENVFEDNVETVTRTPDLIFVDNGTFNKGQETTSGTTTNGSRNDSGTLQNQTTAFNTISKYDTTNNSTSNTIGSQTITDSTTDSSRSDSSSNRRTETGNEVTVYERNRHGNIGITTSAQLLGDDRNIHDFSFYETVTKLMILEFCDSIF